MSDTPDRPDEGTDEPSETKPSEPKGPETTDAPEETPAEDEVATSSVAEPEAAEAQDDQRDEASTLPYVVGAYIQSEIDGSAKDAKRIVVIGMMSTLLVFGYLSWMHMSLEEIVNPETLAEFVTNSAVNSVPELGMELEAALKDAAPLLVDELIRGAVGAVPSLGGALEAELGKAVDEMATFAAQQTASDLADVVEASTGDTPEARVDAALEVLLRNFEYEMTAVADSPAGKGKAKAKAKGAGAPALKETPTVVASLRSSLAALDQIDVRLQALAKQKNLSQQQAMEKQLIQSWMSMIQDP